MGLRDWLNRLFRQPVDNELADLAAAFRTPADLHDRGAWDEYWMTHREFRAREQALADRMSSDVALPALLRERGTRTILCAGNGLSFEAVELALLGFDVTGLDLSGVPAALYGEGMRRPEHPVSRIPGFRVRDDGSVTFGPPGTIAPDVIALPCVHRLPDQPYQGGGSLAFVTGDLTDRVICPGPFDAVIERRTVQLFEGAAQTEALECLVTRLRVPGTLVSHQHSGWWKPGEPRIHFAEAWLRARGFVLHSPADGPSTADRPRLALLIFTSG